jgi:hypothetical protein
VFGREFEFSIILSIVTARASLDEDICCRHQPGHRAPRESMMSPNEDKDHPLIEALRSRNLALAKQAGQLISEANRILEYTLSTFSSGTDHTARHTNAVEQIGSMFLPDPFLADITDHELFLLALACHYHDMAMAGTEADERSVESREQVRKEHAITIGEKIKEKWLELGFVDQQTAEVLGKVCRGHRPKKVDGVANWNELNPDEILGVGIVVRVRLLAALIYAIDELHIGADRAPVKVQNWRQIRNENDRRHWRRHLAVHGPALNSSGMLLLQIDADTPEFEEYLRSQVCLKAFSAVRDLSRQAQEDNAKSPLRTIAVRWKRDDTWQLLLPIISSDLHSRTKSEIEQAILDFWNEQTAQKTDLTTLCTEYGNTEIELRQGIRQCVEDAALRLQLINAQGTQGKLVLSTNEDVANHFLKKMRSADELDQLFIGCYRMSWEERLYESEFGRAYVTNCVFPAVEQSYSVALAQRPRTDPVRVLLERCPTAARLVLQFRPVPSHWVKDNLLREAALAGAFYDLHADPNRILSPELRIAVQTLTEGNVITTPVIRVIEELALIGGFTVEQLCSVHQLSEGARQVAERDELAGTSPVSVSITQTVAAKAPASTHLSNLIYASYRAGVPIFMASENDLQVHVTPPISGVPEQMNMIGFGPSRPDRSGVFYCPARLEINHDDNVIRFVVGRFPETPPSPYPFVIRVPPRPRSDVQNKERFIKFSGRWTVLTQWPQITMRDLRTMVLANRLLSPPGARIEICHEAGGELMLSMDQPVTGQIFQIENWSEDVIRSCEELEDNIPAPLFVPPKSLETLGRLSSPERTARWSELMDNAAHEKKVVSSVFIRIVRPDGVPVEESFLGFYPGLFINPPEVQPGGTQTQEEIDALWERGDVEKAIGGYFDPDILTLLAERQTPEL